MRMGGVNDVDNLIWVKTKTKTKKIYMKINIVEYTHTHIIGNNIYNYEI